jgi:hypothetical protein
MQKTMIFYTDQALSGVKYFVIVKDRLVRQLRAIQKACVECAQIRANNPEIRRYPANKASWQPLVS